MLPQQAARAGIWWAALLAASVASPTFGWEALVLELPANDLAYDPHSQRVYASVPSVVGPLGNSLVAIDPRTGRVGDPVWVGSEPNLLAVSDDGSALYVMLDGAYAVRRVALPALLPGPQFVVENDFGRDLGVEDIEVQPGAPDVIAVSRVMTDGTSPPDAGVAIFDGGAVRAEDGPLHVSARRIEFAADPSVLVGTDPFSSPASLYRLRVDAAGVTLLESSRPPGSGFEMVLAGDRLYNTAGNVIDPFAQPPAHVGSFQVRTGFVNDVAVDLAVGRAYFLYHDGIGIYDVASRAELDEIEIPGIRGFTDDLVLWGSDALAFATSDGQVFLFTTGIFDQDGDGVSDRLDNCVALANPAQADADRDGVGDACDSQPGAPDGLVPQCLYDLGVALDALSLCWSEPRFLDADGDGVHDGNDRCPETPPGRPVDTAGCAQFQFCLSTPLAACERADWRNDEPRGKPRDCVRRAAPKKDGLCWSN